MQTSEISTLNHTLQQTEAWLEELTNEAPFVNRQQAYSGLRAVLHAIRDNLTVEEAAHMASQLPTLVRGIYYEGWRPAQAPDTERGRGEFLDHVRDSLERRTDAPQGQEGLDPEAATRAVTALLERHLTDGQARHVREQLHEEVQALWTTA